MSISLNTSTYFENSSLFVPSDSTGLFSAGCYAEHSCVPGTCINYTTDSSPAAEGNLGVRLLFPNCLRVDRFDILELRETFQYEVGHLKKKTWEMRQTNVAVVRGGNTRFQLILFV